MCHNAISQGIQVSEVAVVNILEDAMDEPVISKIASDGATIELELRGFEIKTFKITLA